MIVAPPTTEFLSFRLSDKPYMTIGILYSLIENPSESSSGEITNFIYHRLAGRYIQPQLNVKDGFESGFLMMASACLLIEAIEAFYDGIDITQWKQGADTFANFFNRETGLFPKYECEKDDFYSHVRCGILHQAETTGGYRILRYGPLFDEHGRSYNATLFLEKLHEAVNKYILDLKAEPRNSVLWKRAINKLYFICHNCKSDI
jgi:hypothetical protein